MKRKALLVFVGVMIGVTSVVGFVWFHEVGQHELQWLFDGYDARYAKKEDRRTTVAVRDTVFIPDGHTRPAVTFVQDAQPPRIMKRAPSKVADTFAAADDFSAETDAGPPSAPATSSSKFDDSGIDSNVGTTAKEPAVGRSTSSSDPSEFGPRASGVSPSPGEAQQDAVAGGTRFLQSYQSGELRDSPGGGGLIVRMVPRTRTVVEQYVDADGQVKTRQHQVTEYVRETITPEDRAEMESFRKAVDALKSAKEEAERTKATEELRGLMHKYFQRDMERREKDLLEAEGRVKQLREQFDKRKAAELDIVNLRLQMMINEATGLGFSLPFDDGNRSAIVGPPTYDPATSPAVPSFAPVASPMIDGPGPGIAPPPIRRNRGKDDGATFVPRKGSPSDTEPLWNPDTTPKPAVIPQRGYSPEAGQFKPDPNVSSDTTEALPEPSVSELSGARVPLNSSALEPENIEKKPSPDKANDLESLQYAPASELDAIEAEVNRSFEELRKKRDLPVKLLLETEREAENLLRTEARVGVLINNLNSPNEARSIVAAKELGRIGKEARDAMPELERLMETERDEKEFPSDKQREAFLEAFLKIHAAAKAEEKENPKSESDLGPTF